jgi:hypothetical protein
MYNIAYIFVKTVTGTSKLGNPHREQRVGGSFAGNLG